MIKLEFGRAGNLKINKPNSFLNVLAAFENMFGKCFQWVVVLPTSMQDASVSALKICASGFSFRALFASAS